MIRNASLLVSCSVKFEANLGPSGADVGILLSVSTTSRHSPDTKEMKLKDKTRRSKCTENEKIRSPSEQEAMEHKKLKNTFY